MEYIYPNLPNYTRLTPVSATSSAIVSPGAVLIGTEDGETLWVKHPDGTYTSIGGGSGMDFYKCASVDTTNHTWTGYKWNSNNEDFESVVTSGLLYTIMTPVVGGIYDAMCLYKISDIAGFVDGQVIFFPFTSDTDTTVGPSATLISGSYTQSIIQGISCLNATSANIRLTYDSLQLPLTISYWAKPGDIKISLGGVDGTTGTFVWLVNGGDIITFKHNVQMYITKSIDNTESIGFYCITLSSTGHAIWKNAEQIGSYSGNFGTFPSSVIDMTISGYITQLSVRSKELNSNEIYTLYNKLHPTAS